MKKEPDKIWSTPELHELYIRHGGTESNRYSFSCRFTQLMQSNILAFTSPGIASVFMPKGKASSLIPLIEDDNEDDMEIHIKAVEKRIKTEVTEMLLDQSHLTKVSSNTLFDECNESLTSLLFLISPSLDKTLASIMVGNIITYTVRRVCTKLQLTIMTAMLEYKKKSQRRLVKL